MPYSVEPKCHSPPRVINEEITRLPPPEFACIPEVTPTSMYLEVIEGKNMSLVCTIKVGSKSEKGGRARFPGLLGEMEEGFLSFFLVDMRCD